MQISDLEMGLINDVSDLLSTDYEIKNNNLTIDDCLKIIEDLRDTVLHLQNELEHKDEEFDDEDFNYDDYKMRKMGLI